MGLKNTIIDLMPGPLVRIFAAPYTAGKGIASGVAKADDLHARLGIYSTVDLLAEEVFRREDVEATVQVYLRMIEALKDRPYASISLKPTSLGINESEAYCQDNLRRIVEAAAAHRIHITLDMEDRHFTDVTLRMFKAIRERVRQLRHRAAEPAVPDSRRTSRHCPPSPARCASASASTTSPPMWPSRTRPT